MTADQNYLTRRMDFWAEGGAYLHGRMHIDGATWYHWIGDYQYMNHYGGGHCGGMNDYVSIWAERRIVASEFNSVSDRRTKANITLSEGSQDLSKLRKLEVVRYQYKDKSRKGDTWRLGFIAQQVMDIFPDAVNVSEEFVPDVYALGTSTKLEAEKLTITMEAPHGLSLKDVVRLQCPSGMHEAEVTIMDDKTFSVEKWKYGKDDVFVFGKKVSDFMVVDYQRVFAMGFSATQELSRQVDVLRAENAALREEIELIKKALGIGGDLPVA
ncbi:MAG: tail fiber domain-containing protein [Bacteroidia bacterium]